MGWEPHWVRHRRSRLSDSERIPLGTLKSDFERSRFFVCDHGWEPSLPSPFPDELLSSRHVCYMTKGKNYRIFTFHTCKNTQTTNKQAPRGKKPSVFAFKINACSNLRPRASACFVQGTADSHKQSRLLQDKKKRPAICWSLSAVGETRTRTGLLPLPPQSSVSTISPPPLCCLGLQRYDKNLNFQIFLQKISKKMHFFVFRGK